MAIRAHHLLALVPAAALLGAPWIANRVEPRILGMPFLLGWIVLWVVLSSGIMLLIGLLDGRATRADGAPPPHHDLPHAEDPHR